MTEPKNVRMIARVTFTNKENEGQVRKRQAFFTTERRAKVLESPKHGLAYRAPVVVDRGPSVTKPAAPKTTKPIMAAEVKNAPPRPKPKPKPRPKAAPPAVVTPEPLPKSDFTLATLRAQLDGLGVFYKKAESKKVLYERYCEVLAEDALLIEDA